MPAASVRGVSEDAPPAERVKLVIADDHAVVRSGLRMLLEAEPGYEVVAEAGDLDSTKRYVRAHRPHVLVLDLHMGEESSLGSISELVESSPDTRVVMLTMDNDPAFAREALAAGASGYVLKEAMHGELLQAVRQAVEGKTYLQPELGARMAAEPAKPSGPPDGLTEREVEVLRLIAMGHTNAEIGQQLFLSVRTVESHRAHIMQKVRLSKRAELVRYALEHGLLES